MSLLMQLAEIWPLYAGMGTGVTGGYFAFIRPELKYRKQQQKALEPVVIEGRTHQEWYDLVYSMGKETVEDMALGPLDGLARAAEYGWDYKKLLGPLYQTLEKEWYPERYVVQAERLMPKHNTSKITTGMTSSGTIYSMSNDSFIVYAVKTSPPQIVEIKERKPFNDILSSSKNETFVSTTEKYSKMDPAVQVVRKSKGELYQLVDLNGKSYAFSVEQVKKFQRLHHIPVDGLIGTYTLWKMEESHDRFGNVYGKDNIDRQAKEMEDRIDALNLNIKEQKDKIAKTSQYLSSP